MAKRSMEETQDFLERYSQAKESEKAQLLWSVVTSEVS
jgi:hypothetical protein